MQKITIYTNSGMMGDVSKIECKLVEIGYKDWAQYKSALYVEYMMPRARKYSDTLRATGYKPFLIVMNGWNHKDVQDPFKIIKDDGEVKVSKSLYMSADPRWVTDFLETFNKQDPNIIVYTIFDDVFLNKNILDKKYTNLIGIN